MPFWGFLKEKFEDMPKWVRVVTYLLLVLVTVYVYMAPRFVTGQVVARTEAGGSVPYRGAAIQTNVAGHLLKFTTNEAGYWTIPIVDRKPGEVKLQVYHEDDRSWFPVTISVTEVWTSDFQIVVSEEKPFVSLEVAALSRPMPERLASNLVGIFLAPARAAELEYVRRPPVEQTPEEEQVFRTEVLNDVRQVVADVTKLSLKELDAMTPMERERGMGYIQRIQVVEALESAYSIKIPDEHWREFRTVGDLATYVADRKELEKTANLPTEISRTADWAMIQQYVEEDEKPKFASRTSAEEKRYWVIVGSHLSEEDAKRQAEAINGSSMNIDAFVGLRVPPNEFYPVIVGGYVPYQQAMDLKSEALMLDTVHDAYLSTGANR